MYFVILLNWGIALYVDSGTLEDGTYIRKTKGQKVALFFCVCQCWTFMVFQVS